MVQHCGVDIAFTYVQAFQTAGFGAKDYTQPCADVWENSTHYASRNFASGT